MPHHHHLNTTRIHHTYTRTRFQQYSYTVDTPYRDTNTAHQSPLVTPLIAPTFQKLSNCSATYNRGFHVGCCVRYVVVTRRGRGEDVNAVESKLPMCFRVWSWILFLDMVRPCYFSSSLSSDLGIDLAWMLACPVIIIVECWSSSRSYSGAHRCLLSGGV